MLSKPTLRDQIETLAPGHYLPVHYDDINKLWPPGLPHRKAHSAVATFGAAHGCIARDSPDERLIWFHKRR